MSRMAKRRSRLPVILCVAGGILIFVVEMFSSWHMTERRVARKNQEKARYLQEHSPPKPINTHVEVFMPPGASHNTSHTIKEAVSP